MPIFAGEGERVDLRVLGDEPAGVDDHQSVDRAARSRGDRSAIDPTIVTPWCCAWSMRKVEARAFHRFGNDARCSSRTRWRTSRSQRSAPHPLRRRRRSAARASLWSVRPAPRRCRVVGRQLSCSANLGVVVAHHARAAISCLPACSSMVSFLAKQNRIRFSPLSPILVEDRARDGHDTGGLGEIEAELDAIVESERGDVGGDEVGALGGGRPEDLPLRGQSDRRSRLAWWVLTKSSK